MKRGKSRGFWGTTKAIALPVVLILVAVTVLDSLTGVVTSVTGGILGAMGRGAPPPQS